MLAAIVVAGQGWSALRDRTGAVAAWALFCAMSNVLPVPAVRNVYLSMSSPVNIAIAATFRPATAALLVAGSSLSEWEIRRQTTVMHAAYNRAQLALSAAAASAVFTVTGRHAYAVLGAVLAVVAYQSTNWGLVAGAEATCRGVPVRRVVRGLLPKHPVAAVSYFVLGLMGVALAVTYERVGGWAVLLLMLPLLGARHAVAAFGEIERGERAQRALSNRLIDERERERARIASEIHDVVLQELAALQLAASNVRSALRTGQTDLASRLAGQLELSAGHAVTSLRGSIASLRRATLDQTGLHPTLARYVRSFSAQSGIDVQLHAERVSDLPLPVAILLFECCREALNNIACHADAGQARIVVRRVGGTVELRVVDDGVGIATPQRRATDGSGLRLLREKVELAGGRFSAAPRQEGGTEVLAPLPTGVQP